MHKKFIVLVLFIIILTNNTFSQTTSPLEINSEGTVNVDKKLKHTNGNTYDPLPVGTILMYSGRDWVDNKIPGWKACTAANNRSNANIPDLENTFIMGTNTTVIADPSVSRTGGKNELVATDLPKHAHNIDHDHKSFYISEGAHRHTFLLASDRYGSGNIITDIDNEATDGNDESYKRFYTENTGSYVGNHSHLVDTPALSLGLSAFVSDNSNADYTSGPIGNNVKMDNRPKYYSVIYIIKVSN